jgi:hypothetical protein
VRDLSSLESCHSAGNESYPGIRVRCLLAFVEQHLHAEADAQTWLSIGKRRADVALRATHRGGGGAERADAGKNENVSVQKRANVGVDRDVPALAFNCFQ